MRRLWVAAALTAMGLGAVIACRQIVGIDDRVATVACGVRVSSDACRACVAGQCCAQASACSASAPCAALEGCLGDCAGEPGCRSRCSIDHPVTSAGEQAAAAALDACLASQCETACGLGCGGVSQIADPDAAASCESCISDNYCKAGEACATSLDCQTYMRCRNTCQTGDCIGACSRDHDAGVGLYSTLLLALAGRCQQACDVGDNWSCVGHVQWPTAKADTRVLTVTFVNIIGGQPLSGVSVKMCGGANCSPPIDTGFTDANGTVRLTDATSATNGQGYGLNGYLDVSGPNIYPALIYWGFPLSEGDALFGTPIPLFPADQWSTFTQGTVTVDMTRGTIAAAALDCLGDQAIGVSFSATGAGFDQETTVRYLQGTALSPMATHTDHAGIGFVFNVPTGSVDVTATPDGVGQISSRNTVQVRQGTLTEVGMSPTPSMQ